jgi:DNA polymerase I-like protein with 3'-5' exonuclease and polymerase domains
MKVVLDIENSVTKRGGKTHFDPFEPTNELVLVGTLTEMGEEEHFSPAKSSGLQSILDKTTLLIGHNIAYDLVWLWECGFVYDGVVFDTMLGEYLLQRGQKQPLSLEACAERYELETQKESTLKDYLKKGVSVADIPTEELSAYLSADLHATQQLYNKIQERLQGEKDCKLYKTIEMTNRVACVLAHIFQRGFTVNRDELLRVKDEFEAEKLQLQTTLDQRVSQLMGDTPINLNSPEQLSWVIYSRKVYNKQTWVNDTSFVTGTEFQQKIKENSIIMYKTVATKCSGCYGNGKIKKTRKDGKPFTKATKCAMCAGAGYTLKPTKEVAGLKFNVPNNSWVTAGGFTTNKGYLETLEATARGRKKMIAVSFLHDVRRLSALDTYLSSFVDGIDLYTKPDGRLHVQLTQHMTATGRFSGRNPNMQNMPRGGTFPIKRVFVSRFEGGKILEADFAQLEFRTAAYLSQDKLAMQEVREGFDVHSYTADIISRAGQPISRQEAKAHTFAPLYGATGFGRSPAEATYYKHFINKYTGIARWHSALATAVLSSGLVTTPSGREFSFPDCERRRNGTPSHFTQIKNYPVQSFATADIVPLVLLYIEELLEGMKTCIVNTVHDSIVLDVHPEEEEYALSVIDEVNDNLHDLIQQQWEIDFNVPLLLEAKIGENWLDTK